MRINLKFILILIVFIALQVIWLNHISLLGSFSPIIYFFPFLILPLEKDENLQLIIGFSTGLVLDIFMNTFGVFTTISVFIVYFRKIFFLYSKNRNKSLDEINPIKVGFGTKLLYYFIYIFIAIILTYLLESFQLKFVFMHIPQMLIDTLISLIIILFIDYFFFSTEQ